MHSLHFICERKFWECIDLLLLIIIIIIIIRDTYYVLCMSPLA